MFGIVSKSSINPLWLKEFKKLAVNGKTPYNDGKGHRDGWGITCFIDGKATYLGREPKDASDETSGFNEAVDKLNYLNAKVLIAHVRNLSIGKPATRNTHPFIYENWVFAHNGTIHSIQAFQVPRHKLEGETDSERFFKYLVEKIGDQEEPKVGVTITNVLNVISNYTSLNFLLSNGKTLFVYRGFKKVEDAAETRRRDEYYTLKYVMGKDFFTVCSEDRHVGTMAQGLNWVDMENGELIIINADDLTVTTHKNTATR